MDTPLNAVLAFKHLFHLLCFDVKPTDCVEKFEPNSRKHFQKADTFFSPFFFLLSLYSKFH